MLKITLQEPMNDRDFMLLAIEEAKKSDELIRCGVVIARNGNVIAKAHNRQRATNNATAHAEINAIQEAGKVLGRKNLENCTMYCTCEPCTMCLSAAIFAKIPKLFYGTSLREASPDNVPITLTTDELLSHADSDMEINAGFMKDECAALLRS